MDSTLICDVLVVGAGPAGCAAAIRLARGGRSVTVADRHPFPRDKVCGDVLMPDALRVLADFGLCNSLQRRGRSSAAVGILYGAGREFELAGEFLGVPRRVLDTAMLEAAQTAGARVVTARLAALGFGGGGVVARGVSHVSRPVSIRAATVILATGADTSLPHAAGVGAPGPPNAFGARRYLASDHDLDRLIVSYEGRMLPGYAWVFPVGPGLYNVGCGVFAGPRGSAKPNLRQVFDGFVNGSPVVQRLLRRGAFVSPLHGAPLRCGLNAPRVTDGRGVFAAGEAIGTTLPLLGEGIGKAMESGLLAADAAAAALEGRVTSGSWYHDTLRARYGSTFDGYGRAQRRLGSRRMVALFGGVAARSRRFRGRLEDVLRENRRPDQVLSITRLMMAPWRSSGRPALR